MRPVSLVLLQPGVMLAMMQDIQNVSQSKTLLKPSELSGLHATKFYDLVVLYKTVKKFRIFIIDLCKKDDHIKTNVLNKNLIIKTSMQLH